MNHWYLVASLPALSFGAEPPLSPADFRARCGEQLPDADLRELDAVLAGGGTSSFAQEWRRFERRLQDESTLLRAQQLGIDPSPWRTDSGVPDAALIAAVRDAMQQPEPKSRELQLDALRWRQLEELTRPTPFGLPSVLAYGLRLQIVVRWHHRTEAAGRERLASHLGAMLVEFDRLAQEQPR